MNPWHGIMEAEQQRLSPFQRCLEDADANAVASLKKPRTTASRGILGTVVAGGLAAWRWLEGRRAAQLSSRRLRLTETISLGEKRFVSILEVDGAQFLIGTCPGGFQLIATFEQQDVPQAKPYQMEEEQA